MCGHRGRTMRRQAWCTYRARSALEVITSRPIPTSSSPAPRFLTAAAAACKWELEAVVVAADAAEAVAVDAVARRPWRPVWIRTRPVCRRQAAQPVDLP